MKSLFFTLLILGGVFAAYDYFLAPPWERMIFEKGPAPVASKSTIPKHEVEDDGPTTSVTEPTPEKTPAPAQTETYTPSIPKLPSSEFTPPTVASLETMTKNWTVIPPQAFPRPVKVKKDVEVKMAVGASLIRSGSTVQALSFDNGLIAISPTETSAARGWVALQDTDFQEQIQNSFEKWKLARIEQARTAWSNAKTAVKAGPSTDRSTMTNGQGISFDASGKPVQNPDGSYNLLLAVISSGQITDVDPANVKHWATPVQQSIDGKPTWVIKVDYKAKTIFGLMDVESLAHVRDGHLIRWVYPSGEPLP